MKYKISIKKNNVVRISENPYKYRKLPSKWEVWKNVESIGECQQELLKMFEKCEIEAYKIEWK